MLATIAVKLIEAICMSSVNQIRFQNGFARAYGEEEFDNVMAEAMKALEELHNNFDCKLALPKE